MLLQKVKNDFLSGALRGKKIKWKSLGFNILEQKPNDNMKKKKNVCVGRKGCIIVQNKISKVFFCEYAHNKNKSFSFYCQCLYIGFI